jgi:hypothetical protein
MKILSKIIFFLLALIILAVGYFVGTIILISIGALILLMSVLFIISWLFNNLLNISTNKTIKYIIKLVFCVLINIGFLVLFISLLKEILLKALPSIQIVVIWVFNIFIFTILYTLLKSKTKEISLQKDMYLLNTKKTYKIITVKDIVVMIIFPALITIIYYFYFFI